MASFLSIDIAATWLPLDDVYGSMVFGAARHLPDLVTLVTRIEHATTALEIDDGLAGFVSAVVASGALRVAGVRDEHSAARGVRRAREFLTAHAGTNPSLDAVASHAGMNKFVLVRWFRRVFGITPHAYLMTVRIDHARALLSAGMTSAEAGATTGFADQAHFSRWFKRLTGITPTTYARQTRRLQQSISFKTPPLARR